MVSRLLLKPFALSSLACLLSGNAATQASSRELAIALTPLSEAMPFYARMTNGNQRLVVTPVTSGAWVVKKVSLKPSEKLFMAELRTTSTSVENELFHWDRMTVFSAASEEEANKKLAATGDHSHAIAVSQELITPTSRQTPIETSDVIPGDALPDISAENLQRSLEEFTGARPTTIAGTEITLGERSSATGREKARAWLSERYKALGYSVSEHSYFGGVNFVAEKPGKHSDQILIVSSHYDTVRTAGADDDGAGTISALMIAEALAEEDNAPTLRFVAFDQEETGLLGSKAYAKAMKNAGEMSRLKGLINLEMTSYDKDDDGAFHSIHCNENDSATLVSVMEQLITQAGIALRRVDACTNRSDHAAFWNYDRPAIVISQNFFGGDDNPCYHKACDTTKNVNWNYFHKLTRASAGLVKHFTQKDLR